LTMGSYGLAVKAVFRLGPSNQTMYLPGEGIPVPVFWPVYQQYAMGGCDGRKGTWLLNVTALTSQAQDAFKSDNRVWIYALLVNPSSILDSVWVPVNGSWKLRMDKDWNAAGAQAGRLLSRQPVRGRLPLRRLHNELDQRLPAGGGGAPSKYRGWRSWLAAWKPLLPNESYSGAAINAVWSGSATYALYNVTFKHVDSGWVYWQPVAVSALKIESATAKYKLSSYDSQLRRSPIYMWIEAVVNWTYVPPNVTLPTPASERDAVDGGLQAPPHRQRGGCAGERRRSGGLGAARLRVRQHGQALHAIDRRYRAVLQGAEGPQLREAGLQAGGEVRRPSGSARRQGGRRGAGEGRGELHLAPRPRSSRTGSNNDPSQLVVDWDCFTSGSLPLQPGEDEREVPADLYYEWGQVDPYNGTLPPLGRDVRTASTRPCPRSPRGPRLLGGLLPDTRRKPVHRSGGRPLVPVPLQPSTRRARKEAEPSNKIFFLFFLLPPSVKNKC